METGLVTGDSVWSTAGQFLLSLEDQPKTVGASLKACKLFPHEIDLNFWMPVARQHQWAGVANCKKYKSNSTEVCRDLQNNLNTLKSFVFPSS